MSLVISQDEVMSTMVLDSRDRKFGTQFNFIVPGSSSFLNFTRVKRIALTSANIAFFPFNINEYNNKFTITDGVNSYNVVIPPGFMTTKVATTPPNTSNYKFVLESAMNANPYGWTFTVSVDNYSGRMQWTSSVPTRVSSIIGFPITDMLGIVVTPTLSINYVGAIYNNTYSNVFYICSKALTRDSVRDVHSNGIVNNIIGIMSISDQNIEEDYYHTNRSFTQIKVFDFEPSQPIGGEIDIYVQDAYGNLIYEYPEYASNRLTLEFLIVSTRNPIVQTLIKER